jgi:hypothetical protein
MLVIGGMIINPERQLCDAKEDMGQHGLLIGQESIEMNTQWASLKTNISSYRVPSNITAVIGGEYVWIFSVC